MFFSYENRRTMHTLKKCSLSVPSVPNSLNWNCPPRETTEPETKSFGSQIWTTVGHPGTKFCWGWNSNLELGPIILRSCNFSSCAVRHRSLRQCSLRHSRSFSMKPRQKKEETFFIQKCFFFLSLGFRRCQDILSFMGTRKLLAN